MPTGPESAAFFRDSGRSVVSARRHPWPGLAAAEDEVEASGAAAVEDDDGSAEAHRATQQKGSDPCPEVMEQARPVAAAVDEAGRAGRWRLARADSAFARVAGTRCPTCRASPATRRLAPSAERR